MSHFDVDQYLLGEESIPVTVTLDSLNCLFLHDASASVSSSVGTSRSSDPFSTPSTRRSRPMSPIPSHTMLREGSQVQLPLWLALSSRTKDLVRLTQLPRILSLNFLEALAATQFSLGDAKYRQINLKEQSPYFFDLAVSYSSVLEGDDSDDEDSDEAELLDTVSVALKTLTQAFQRRYQAWLLRAFSPVPDEDDLRVAEKQLTNIEFGLFQSARRSVRMIDLWERNREVEEEERMDLRAALSSDRTAASLTTPPVDESPQPDADGDLPMIGDEQPRRRDDGRLTGKKRKRKRKPGWQKRRQAQFFSEDESRVLQDEIDLMGGQVLDEDGDSEMQEREMESRFSEDEDEFDEEGEPPRKRRRMNKDG